MTHSNMSNGVPSAIVVSRNPKTSSLDEMRLYEGKYFFLENGQEFQIRVFNPLSETIAAKIKFNGESSSSMLVIRPGEDVTIDRFLDDKKKMLFETYEINGGNKAALDAVAQNGLLSVEFYKEKQKLTSYSTSKLYKTNLQGDITTSGNVTLDGWDGNMTTMNIGSQWDTYGQIYSSNTSTHDINGDNINAVYTSSVDFGDNQVFNMCDTSGMHKGVPLNDTDAFFNTNPLKDVIDDLDNLDLDESGKIKETGRVERGGNSDQEFQTVDKEFNIFPFHTIEYELKPTSEHKNIIPTEIRDYCTDCGYRMRKKSWQYCPKCGEKV